jgi:putative membrane protein
VVQAAMRRGEDLPPTHQPILLGAAVAVVGVAVVALLLHAGGTL